MSKIKRLPQRSKVRQADTWDLSSLFDGDQAWEDALRKFERRFPNLAKHSGKLGDNECSMLARDVAKRVEGEMQYPGQIKVTVLRELRVSEFAK